MRNPLDSESMCPKHKVPLEQGLCPLCAERTEGETPISILAVGQNSKRAKTRREEKCLGCGLPLRYCKC